jgi:hypothetical protein
MSHSDDAILMQMRESADYKLGYMRSSMRTVLMYLQKGDTESAIKEIHNTLNSVRVNYAEV